MISGSWGSNEDVDPKQEPQTVQIDPLDEYEATLREARARSGNAEPDADLDVKARLLRQLTEELAAAVNEAAGHARHRES
ncbi:MAG: hypothetical protein QOF08_2476 [Gaiellales bacterium]|nr:hypothetical protein [Gaiellales bacterium]